MRHDLTSVQQKILDFIVETIRDHDRSPTIREIGDAFGIASTNGVRYHLDVLQQRGYIRRHKGISRGIEWLEHHALPQRSDVARIPLVGSVAAGAPILAIENVEDEIAVDDMFVRGEGCFALRVTGDSMRDAGILDGDVVAVNPQPTAKGGDIVVALIDDEATVKIYSRRKGRVVLEARNPDYDDIVLNEGDAETRILGTVVGLMRRF